jgi:adenine-specific DNA-methyltransferase
LPSNREATTMLQNDSLGSLGTSRSLLRADGMEPIRDERELTAICAALGARQVAGWTSHEAALVARANAPASTPGTKPATKPATNIDPQRLAAIRAFLRQGHDPLGEAFCALRSPAARRPAGATYTPPAMVDAMVGWARAEIASAPAVAPTPARIVDPGTGSGRFLVAAGRVFPHARLIGVEVDPLAAMMARASLAANGMAGRSFVFVADYRDVELAGAGPTLFLGNPPYVRHHDIPACWKSWLAETAAARGLAASRLAGLHVHFLLATLVHARPGDAGAFVTSAEWLDVNYGQLARDLISGPLGGLRIDVIEPTAQAFADAQSTAAITCFRVGAATPSMHMRRVRSLAALAPLRHGRRVSRRLLASSARWTPLLAGAARHASPRLGEPADPGDLVELGELCRVHRGQVTGANQIWIADQATPWLPASVLFPAVTRARELFAAGDALADDAGLRRVIDLPPDFGRLCVPERKAVERFLGWARARGGDASYIARHRSPWWSVRLREPPPILATYMARRPPMFVRNRVRARFLNIAHGLYPRAPLPDACLDALAAYLSANVAPGQGRTYAGGLIKFEPSEMERILVPRPEALARSAR